MSEVTETPTAAERPLRAPATSPRSHTAGGRAVRLARQVRGRRRLPGSWAVAALVAFTVTSASGVSWWPLSVLQLAVGVILPGLLVVDLVPARIQDQAVRLVLAVALGLLVLMGTGALLDVALPTLGVGRPLSTSRVLPAYVLVVALLVLARAHRARHTALDAAALRARALHALALRRVWPFLALATLPLGAAAGAVWLDNGHGGAVAGAVLSVVTVMLVVLVVRAPRVRRSVLLAAVYAAALTLLLMTSSRGRFPTGHDVQTEYRVFVLAMSHWQWSIADLRDPYNASLSITVLPTVLAALLHQTVLVFKLLFPLLIALVPVGVAVLGERLAGRRGAVLAAVLFLGFPTFVVDLPMLNRQGIAFLFVTALVLVLVTGEPTAFRRSVFAALGVGCLLAHYSTTYLLLAQLWLAALALTGYGLVRRLLRRPRPDPGEPAEARLLTVPMALGLTVATLVWVGPLTGTYQGALDTAAQTVRGVLSGSAWSIKSVDTAGSIFGGRRVTPAEQVRDYAGGALQRRVPGVAYYPAEVASRYVVRASPPAVASPTPLGRTLERVGVDPFGLNAVVRRAGPVLWQLLVPLAILALVLRRPLPAARQAQLVALSCAVGTTLAGMVLLPYVSVDYGLLRAFQQGLIVLAAPTVLVALLPARAGRAPRQLHGRWAAATAVAVALFVSGSGILAWATGGYYPQLHLADQGVYVDDYYVNDAEVAAAAWALAHAPPSASRGASTGGSAGSGIDVDAGMRNKLFGLFGAWASSDALPALVRRQDYVVLGRTNVVGGRAIGSYRNDAVEYIYPIAFLEENKDRVYTTSSSAVFR